MSWLKKHTEALLLLAILLIGAILRLHHYSDFSYTNDELSALLRLQANSFSELLETGVRPDVHPAGVQAFLWQWVGWFGTGEAAVRLPFVILGILSIVLAWLIGRRWFGSAAGLFTAAAIAFLEYPIMYSQVARPYSPGLFFSLLAVWCWTLILFRPGNKVWFKATGYVVAMLCCAYIHYFSLLFAVIIGATGLFFMNNENRKPYLISNGIVALGYVPHLGIFSSHLSVGTPGNWLAPPGGGWFWEYIRYVFNDSWLMLAVVLAVVVFGIALSRKTLRFGRYRYIALMWFLLPFLIGYIYSVFRTPVLQKSLLIFSFPFLLVFLFSFLPNRLNRLVLSALCLFIAMGVYSTVLEQKFYQSRHFGEFKDIARKTIEWADRYGEENITKSININNRYYIDFYLERFGRNIEFDKYRQDNGKDFGEFLAFVNQSETSYFLYGWSTRTNYRENEEIVKTKYPFTVERINYGMNSCVALYARKNGIKPEPLFRNSNDFEAEYPYWNGKTDGYDTGNVFSGRLSERLGKGRIYGTTFEMEFGNISHGNASVFITVTAKAYLTDGASGNLVITFTRGEETLEWYATALEDFIFSRNTWGVALACRAVPENIHPTDKVKVYVWNTGEKDICIDDLVIEAYPVE